MDSGQNRLNQIQRQLIISNQIIEQIHCPKATLNSYRTLSNINQQHLKEHFYGKNWQYRDKCFKIIQDSPAIFRHHHLDESSRDEQRLNSYKAIRAFIDKLSINFDDIATDPNIATMTSAAMYAYDPSVCVKFGVHFTLYMKTIMNLGTEKHLKFLEPAKTMDDIGSFSLTELGHGSNVRNLLTTAIFNRERKCFVLNTPHDMAMKFWIGATANLANITVVFAQLYIDDNQYGVHGFLVEIRDKKTHIVKNGIIVGDCGPKNGNNGIDNGFLIFKNVDVPLDNLLDRFSQVNGDGLFTTSIQDADKRFAVQLGSLSGGRVILSMYGAISSFNSLSIALRYSAIRKQFGNQDEPEQSIIEYPLTQLRLIPELATSLIYLNASVKLTILWDQSQAIIFDPNNHELSELHAISSSLKGLTNLHANQIIMECRQILGGHGYHQFNRLGTMLADIDINTTWEGDTNVLMQQTAKFLMDCMNKLSQGKPTKFQTLKFLSIQPTNESNTPFTGLNAQEIKEQLLNQNNLSKAIEHRCNTLVQLSALKFQKNLNKLGDIFGAWNASQPFYLQKAARAYADVYCMQEWIKANQNNIINKDILDKTFQIWALKVIEQDYALFRDTNWLNYKQSVIIRELILELCDTMKSQVIGIVDALAPPDEVLGSPFGQYDGDIYNSYLKFIYKSKNCFSRVDWWEQIHPNQK